MKKDIHIRIDSKLSSELKELATLKNQSVNSIVSNLIKDGIYNISTKENINRLNNDINRLTKDIYYIKQLLIQTYADMDLEQRDISTSTNLIKFNKKIKKDKMYD